MSEEKFTEEELDKLDEILGDKPKLYTHAEVQESVNRAVVITSVFFLIFGALIYLGYLLS